MRKLYIIQILLLCCLGVMAQKAGKSLTISGIVVDKSSDKEPIIGANIFLKDRPGVGTTTDLDGRFKVQAHKGDVLIVNYIGYDKIEYFVTDSQTNLVLKMTPSATALDEVVVVGMGTQRKVSVVGAITSVDIGDLAVPATSLNNSLGGRVPGVISIQSSGEPGKNISEFWVRGIGTFGANSSALVLIDGLEGDLSQVDPADVESFSVLKDASATAVYGVRGANGVILVTTKRGTVEKLKITARANFTISQLKRLPKYLRAYDYAKLANEARVVSGEKELYSPMEMDLIQYQLDPDLYPDVVQSTPFLLELFPVEVTDKEKELSTTLYDYMSEHQRKAWWGYIVSAPFKALGAVMSLISGDEEESEGLNPYHLTKDQEEVVKALQERVSVSVDKKTLVITASVQMQDPVISAQMTKVVLENLQNYITNYRTQKVKQDLEFTQKVFGESRDAYYKAQRAYAAFEDANRNIISSSYRTEQERLKNEMTLTFNVYNTLAQKLEQDKLRVQEETPVYTVIEPATVPLKASSPKKALILVGFVFLALFGCIGYLFVKDMFVAAFKKEETGA